MQEEKNQKVTHYMTIKERDDASDFTFPMHHQQIFDDRSATNSGSWLYLNFGSCHYFLNCLMFKKKKINVFFIFFNVFSRWQFSRCHK